jgi:hypothetical protein
VDLIFVEAVNKTKQEKHQTVCFNHKTTASYQDNQLAMEAREAGRKRQSRSATKRQADRLQPARETVHAKIQVMLLLLTTLWILESAQARHSSLRSLQSNLFGRQHDTGTASQATVSAESTLTAERDSNSALPAIDARQSSCALSDAGFYGALTRNPLSVTFLYQVNIRASEQVVKSTILPVIDKAMVEGILPDLFVECGGSSSDIIGISSQPLDTVSSANSSKCDDM